MTLVFTNIKSVHTRNIQYVFSAFMRHQYDQMTDDAVFVIYSHPGFALRKGLFRSDQLLFKSHF